jgi:hypothetical protein
MSLLPPTFPSDDVQNNTRLDPAKKSETSWSCQQVPSWLSSSQSHGRSIPTISNPLKNVSILEDSKLSGVLGTSEWVVLIHEKLQLDPICLFYIRPINLVYLLHLGNKRKGGRGSCAQKEARQRRIRKTYSWILSGLKFFNRSVISVLYVERTIAIHDCHLF